MQLRGDRRHLAIAHRRDRFRYSLQLAPTVGQPLFGEMARQIRCAPSAPAARHPASVAAKSARAGIDLRRSLPDTSTTTPSAGPLRPRWVNSSFSRKRCPHACAVTSAETPAMSAKRSRSALRKVNGTSAARHSTMRVPLHSRTAWRPFRDRNPAGRDHQRRGLEASRTRCPLRTHRRAFCQFDPRARRLDTDPSRRASISSICTISVAARSQKAWSSRGRG